RIKLGICSNKPAALTRGLVDAFGLTRLFDAAFGPEDAGKPKPDPAMLRIAMQKLGVSAAETLYIGDMPVDVETARNAGVTAWVATTGSSDLESLRRARPDRILSGMAELPSAVLFGK